MSYVSPQELHILQQLEQPFLLLSAFEVWDLRLILSTAPKPNKHFDMDRKYATFLLVLSTFNHTLNIACSFSNFEILEVSIEKNQRHVKASYGRSSTSKSLGPEYFSAQLLRQTLIQNRTF